MQTIKKRDKDKKHKEDGESSKEFTRYDEANEIRKWCEGVE